jgi:hypothetical protein
MCEQVTQITKQAMDQDDLRPHKTVHVRPLQATNNKGKTEVGKEGSSTFVKQTTKVMHPLHIHLLLPLETRPHAGDYFAVKDTWAKLIPSKQLIPKEKHRSQKVSSFDFARNGGLRH